MDSKSTPLLKKKKIEKKFDKFAKHIVSGALNDHDDTVFPCNKKKYLEFGKESYAKSGKGAIIVYPTVYNGYDISKIREAKIEIGYLSLKELKSIEDMETDEGMVKLEELMEKYNFEKEFVLHITPYDEKIPDKNDIDTCYSMII